MREVIFRGKRLDSGKWDEGYYVYSPYSGADGKHGIAYADGPLGFVVSEADPSTIGQFTGLTDKNGKRIFEGDIVTGRFSKENVRGHIVYGSDATFFIDRGGLHGIGLNNSEDWLEVIGNIHDNEESRLLPHVRAQAGKERHMRYIDADALIQKVGFLEGRVVGVYGSDILAAPTADVVEVVHGRWELLDECSNAGVYCSVCHKAVFRESAWYKNVNVKSKFCPSCGAKMEDT